MIRTVPVTGSTNDDIAALASAGAPEGAWLRAERQTGGKGRQGRAWQSPPGNLHASTLVRVSGLTRCGAEKVRETVEICTPDARATSLIVAGTAPLPPVAVVTRWGH